MKRKIVLAKKIHLWIGLVCGFVSSISGLSGSLYVWQPEILQALNPEVLTVSSIDTLKEETIHETATKLYTRFGGDLSALHLPYREQQSVQLVFKDGKNHYFHPGTGLALGEKTSSIRFFEHLLRFHRTLLIPRYGNYLVGGSAILFFLLLLTSGVYLWWKRYSKNPRKGFSVSKNLPRGILYYDFHKLLGILFLIPLLVISVSGSFFTFMPTWKAALQVLDSPAKETKRMSGEAFSFHSLEEALSLPSEDEYKLRSVYFPEETSGKYRFRYVKNRFISAGLRETKEIEVNQDLQVMMFAEYHQNSLSEKIGAQAYPVHIGETIGLLGRIAVFITGLIPSILLITGYRFYRFRKSNRRQDIKSSFLCFDC